MAKRAISREQRAWLAGELETWREQAVVTAPQVERILDLYETTAESAERQHARAIFTLMSVAAFLVGLAALLLVGYNWEAMPRFVKLGIIFGVVTGTHAVGFWLRYQRQAKTLSEVAFFLGCLFYGAGIWLVAQVFHINAHYPDGIWWWALGVLPFALCLDTLLLHGLLVGLLGLWAGVEILNFHHLGGWFFGRWTALPNAALTLPLFAAPGLLWAYRKKSPATVGLYAPLLAWWVVLQPFAWHWQVNPIYFLGTVGGLFLLIAESHRPGSPFAIPYRLYGTVLAGGVLIPLSYHRFNTDLFLRGPESMGMHTLAMLGLALAVLVGVFFHARSRPAEERADLPRRLALPVGLILFMVMLSWWTSYLYLDSLGAGTALIPTILANVAMVGCALWLMRVGVSQDRGQPFAAGVLYFLLWAVLRYVDLFGDFGGMLGASLMFFLCGAALFGVASYWRNRKEVRRE